MTRPRLGRSSPARTIIRLDLPDPDGPTRATVSPGSMASETPRRMSPGPAALARVSATSSSRTSLSPGGGGVMGALLRVRSEVRTIWRCPAALQRGRPSRPRWVRGAERLTLRTPPPSVTLGLSTGPSMRHRGVARRRGGPLRNAAGSIVAALLAVAAPGSGTAAAAHVPEILVFGDSLTAGPGFAAEETFPARLEGRLKSAGINSPVGNAR